MTAPDMNLHSNPQKAHSRRETEGHPSPMPVPNETLSAILLLHATLRVQNSKKSRNVNTNQSEEKSSKTLHIVLK